MSPNTNTKICSGCDEEIADIKAMMLCKSGGCQKVFCNLCIPIKLSMAEKNVWSCPDCKALSKRGGDNTSTPVRTLQSDSNVTIRNKNKTSQSKPGSGPEPSKPAAEPPKPQTPKRDLGDLAELTSEIKLLRCDMSDLKSQITSALDSLAKCQTRMDEITGKLTDTERRLQALEDQQSQNVRIKATLQDLENKYNIQAQLALRNDVEIIGCPEIKNENLHHTMMAIATKIGASVSDVDIDYVSRAGHKRKQSSNEFSQLPRPVIVRFARRKVRDDFIAKSKIRRNLDTTDIITEGTPQKIYINERLTRENRQLFRIARERAAQANFKYCWTRGGFIYARKRDGADAINIINQDCIDRVFGTEHQLGSASKDFPEE
ncbi:uncharacterized protein LOC134654391 [Cydia amplana]|uniref:uncharacterized protein LOC134654391 n=1 Tax=Cydia amplana TaxID=1869771 RepID=UPI002FE56ECA